MFGIEYQIKINKAELQWLKPLLEGWLRVHRDYLEANDCTDSLYWYNERANIGALAGAIWRSGGYALEEYGAVKGKGADASMGRVDLFFKYAGQNVTVEAKQKWVKLIDSNSCDFKSLIAESIADAVKDIKRTQNASGNGCGLGIAFLPTYSKSIENENKSMRNYCDAIELTNCDFYVWMKNVTGKSLVSSINNHCNAIALVGVMV